MFRDKPKHPNVYKVFISFTDTLKRCIRGWEKSLKLFVKWAEHHFFDDDPYGRFWSDLNDNSTYQKDYYQRLRDKYT